MHKILYLNGSIYTMDAHLPRAQALAIGCEDGRILAVGSNDEIRRYADRSTEMVDLRGRTVLPGFIDAHIHLLETAFQRQRIDASGCRSEEEVAELVRRQAAVTPAGQWIQGGHWDRNDWPGQRFPTRASLDAAAPEHPVALASKDFHLLWANSRALELAHVDASTPDLATGAILRDGAGNPTGVLQENDATALVFSVIAPPAQRASRVWLAQELQRANSYGITSLHDVEGELSLQLFQQLQAEKQLSVRVQMLMPRQMLDQLAAIGQELDPADRDLLRIGGVKIFADGTLGSQTAAMFEGYEGNPDSRGILALSEEEMKETVQRASAQGWNVAIHAIGDRAAHVALNSIEHAIEHVHGRLSTRAESTPDAHRTRYRIEHVQLLTSDDLVRMRRLGVIASVQPYHAVADRDIAERYWGARHRHSYAYRTMQRIGIPLALGSDAPIETYDPLRILYAATVRSVPLSGRPSWLPEQELSLIDALNGYTLGAAYSGGEENDKGSITAGKLGDAVVLRTDLLQEPPERLLENGVQATIVGGRIVYGSL